MPRDRVRVERTERRSGGLGGAINDGLSELRAWIDRVVAMSTSVFRGKRSVEHYTQVILPVRGDSRPAADPGPIQRPYSRPEPFSVLRTSKAIALRGALSVEHYAKRKRHASSPSNRAFSADKHRWSSTPSIFPGMRMLELPDTHSEKNVLIPTTVSCAICKRREYEGFSATGKYSNTWRSPPNRAFLPPFAGVFRALPLHC